MDIKIRQVPSHIGWFIAGFVDGEGSFVAKVKRVNDRRLPWKIDLVFSVAQKEKPIIALIRRYIGCGRIYQRIDGAWYLEVNNLQALKENVIPFFTRFRLLSSTKKQAFSLFKRLVEMKSDGQHLESEGLRKMLAVREKLNATKGRNKKYSFPDPLRDYTPDSTSKSKEADYDSR